MCNCGEFTVLLLVLFCFKSTITRLTKLLQIEETLFGKFDNSTIGSFRRNNSRNMWRLLVQYEEIFS